MKVLIVNGSSHVNGTTMQAIQEVQKVFSEANVDTEVIQLGNNLFVIVFNAVIVLNMENVYSRMMM